jgi:hypothetical protein
MNTVSRENTATILAALRLFQDTYRDVDAEQIREKFPEHFHDVQPLSTEDIDTLCQQINNPEKNTFTFTEEEIGVLLRGLTFALDMGEENYFAFYPDADGYSDGDQDKDAAARLIALALRDRLGS